jgi:hypothetical protein
VAVLAVTFLAGPICTTDHTDALVPETPQVATVDRHGPAGPELPQVAPLEKTTVSVTDAATLAKLAADANRLPAFPSGTMLCPMDDGSYYRVSFAFPGGGRDVLYAQRRGCQGVGHELGRWIAWSAADTAFLEDLDALFL